MKITKKNDRHIHFETGVPWYWTVIAFLCFITTLILSTKVVRVQITKDTEGVAKASIIHRLVGMNWRFYEVINLTSIQRERVRNSPGTESRFEIWFEGANGRFGLSTKKYGNHEYSADRYTNFLEDASSLLKNPNPRSIVFRAEEPYWHYLIVSLFFLILFVVFHQRSEGHLDIVNRKLYLRVRRFVISENHVLPLTDISCFKLNSVCLKSGRVIKLQLGRDMNPKLSSYRAVEHLNKVLISMVSSFS